MLTKFEMTFPGTPVDPWHGDEEKQGAHMKREAGVGMRIGKQKERSRKHEDVRVIERDLHHINPVSCFMTLI